MKDCSQNLGPRLRHLSNRILDLAADNLHATQEMEVSDL